MEENIHSDSILLARVAWAYYCEGLTQAQVAHQLNLTRARVNRLLREGHKSGTVQIIINSSNIGRVQLESRLTRRYGLRQSIVVPTPTHDDRLYDSLGMAAGIFVSDHLRDDQSLGLGWGRTLSAGVRGISQRARRNNTIVSLFGGLPHSHTTNPYEIASLFARRLRASECYYIPAPMYAPSVEIKNHLIEQSQFRTVYERAARVDMALIGVGDLTPRSTNVQLGALSEEEWRSVLAAGAVSELFGHFLDARGEPVDHPLNTRFMGPSLADMHHIPLTVVVSGGLKKVPALKAVLSKEYIDILITDETTAEILTNGCPECGGSS
ncbi:MAG: sugar-binding transcriptional regulator [Desulfovibrionales bacterium]